MSVCIGQKIGSARDGMVAMVTIMLMYVDEGSVPIPSPTSKERGGAEATGRRTTTYVYESVCVDVLVRGKFQTTFSEMESGEKWVANFCLGMCGCLCVQH